MTLTKTNITLDNPKGEVVELTAEEIEQAKIDTQRANEENQAELKARQNQIDLKASAKTKLMNGEALTEDEANVMVGF